MAQRGVSPKRVTVALLSDGDFDYAIMEPHERPVFASSRLASVIITPRTDCDAAADQILTKLKAPTKRTANDSSADSDYDNPFASFISLPVYDGDARVITDCIVPFTPSPSRSASVRRAHRRPYSEQRRLRR
jgi:hypothetical protein